MVRKFRALLHPPLVEDIYDSILEMQISGDTASVTLLNRLFIDPRSSYAEFAKIVLVKVEIDLKKTLDGQWLIIRTEILAINNQPTKWSNVGYIDW
jgi:ketosteroid isomerase-like protein